MFFATNNRGEFIEVERRFGKYGIELVSPDDLGIKLEVPETGRTLEANASTKVRLYAVRLKSLRAEGQVGIEDDLIIMADDTGLEIDALGGEPGVKARRWKDEVTHMSDEEIIEYCLDRMEQVSPEARGAEFRTVIAIQFPIGAHGSGEAEIEYFDGRLRGLIVKEPSDQRYEGLPFDSIFYIPEWEMLLGEARRVPDNEKEKYFTHGNIAVDKALERILEFLTNEG